MEITQQRLLKPPFLRTTVTQHFSPPGAFSVAVSLQQYPRLCTRPQTPQSQPPASSAATAASDQLPGLFFRHPRAFASHHVGFSCTAPCVCSLGRLLPLPMGCRFSLDLLPGPLLHKLGHLTTGSHLLRLLLWPPRLHALSPWLHVSSCRCPQPGPCGTAATCCDPRTCRTSLAAWAPHRPCPQPRITAAAGFSTPPPKLVPDDS